MLKINVNNACVFTCRQRLNFLNMLPTRAEEKANKNNITLNLFSFLLSSFTGTTCPQCWSTPGAWTARCLKGRQWLGPSQHALGRPRCQHSGHLQQLRASLRWLPEAGEGFLHAGDDPAGRCHQPGEKTKVKFLKHSLPPSFGRFEFMFHLNIFYIIF